MCQIELLHVGRTRWWFHVWPRQTFSVTLPVTLPHSNRVWLGSCSLQLVAFTLSLVCRSKILNKFQFPAGTHMFIQTIWLGPHFWHFVWIVSKFCQRILYFRISLVLILLGTQTYLSAGLSALLRTSSTRTTGSHRWGMNEFYALSDSQHQDESFFLY